MENEAGKSKGAIPKTRSDKRPSANPRNIGLENRRRTRQVIDPPDMANGLRRTNEEIKREEENVPDTRPVSTIDTGHPLNWVPLFTNQDSEKENEQGVSIPLQLRKNRKPFTSQWSNVEFQYWNERFRSIRKDKAIQTDPVEDECPLCVREEARRFLAALGGRVYPSPSIIQPAPANARFKDASVEAPDRTYYGSHQLVFFSVGNFAYRGWTYRTLDGRVEHVPRVPRAIPLHLLRVEKPLRTPAPK